MENKDGKENISCISSFIHDHGPGGFENLNVTSLYPRSFKWRNVGGRTRHVNPFGAKGRRFYQWLVSTYY